MTTLLAAVFTASLVGSLHCAGMCGGFVAFCAGTGPDRRLLGSHLAWNGGRLAIYALLGAVAGGIGQAVDLAGSAAGVQRVAAVLAGAAMVGWGLLALARALGAPLPPLAAGGWIGRLFGRVVARLGRRPPVVRAAVLGLCSALLPCGWLYAFVLTAAGTGSVLGGLLVMLAFWAGTVPLLAGMGVLLARLAGPVRRHVPVVSAAALVLIGLLAVTGRANLPAPAATPAIAAQGTGADAVERVRGLPSEGAPCCHGEQ